ncbi:MAG TPA: SusD/RagB family nutrient-binding outer membrane lipoprotein [Balneolaceae bacterium]
MRKLTLSIFALCLVLVSCDLAGLNQNEKAPTDVPADPLFTNAQLTLGNYIHNSTVNVNIFKMVAQHWTATDYPQEAQYQLDNRTIPSTIWSLLYRNALNDLKEAEAKIAENEVLAPAVKQNKLATIEVLNVYTYTLLVNLFGNIPYTEALNFENTQPAYDDAETIYMDLMSRLDTAIGMFDTGAAGFGSADIYYSDPATQVASWVKFANSLKMRMAITIADVNPTAAKTAIVEAAPNAISSNAENAMIPFQASPPHANPVWEQLVQSGRDDFIPAAPLTEIMNNLNDPRRPVFMDTTGSGAYLGGPYGVQNTYADFSHFSALMEKPDRPGMLLGYSEVEFILAEAAARGFIPGGMAVAATHYENAIRADMAFWGVPEAEVDAYMAQTNVAYLTAPGTWREKIGTQKWLGLFLQGFQAWTEFRRLDTPNLDQNVPEEAVIDVVPLRYTYPIDEQNFNEANYQKAASAIGGDKLTTPLFWDVN